MQSTGREERKRNANIWNRHLTDAPKRKFNWVSREATSEWSGRVTKEVRSHSFKVYEEKITRIRMAAIQSTLRNINFANPFPNQEIIRRN